MARGLQIKVNFGADFKSAVKELAYITVRIKEIFPDATPEQLEQVGDMLVTLFAAHIHTGEN